MIEPAPQITPVMEAQPEDINGILEVQNGLLHTNNEELDRGFLWYPVEAKELGEIIANPNNHFLAVAKEGDEVIGYTLAYDLKEWQRHKPEWFGLLDVSEEIKERIKNEKVFYGRHIAVANQRAGIGSNLNRALQQAARDHGCSMLLVEIMKKP
ncbi:MAG: GNAT family N-acetyltransferase, partial [Candidatus Paceibacterota bacterium]